MNKGFCIRLVTVIALVATMSRGGATSTFAYTIRARYTAPNDPDGTHSRRLTGGDMINDAAEEALFPATGGERGSIQRHGVAGLSASYPPTETLATDVRTYPSPSVPQRDTQKEGEEEEGECKTCDSTPGVGAMSLTPMSEGGSDSFGYTFKDSHEPDGPDFDFIDISTTGTPVTLWDDDGDGPFPIGFNFPFYGETKTDFYISSNGYIAFNARDLIDYGNDCPVPNINDPDDIIAIYWDDLDPGYTGDLVYYDTLSPCPYGGTGACLVVEYENYHHFGWYGGIVAGTFETILFENGDILVQFEDAGDWMGYGSTTGIENSTHTAGLTYACNSPDSISDGLAILFSYPLGLRLNKAVNDALPSPGQRITYALTVGAFDIHATNAVVSDTLPAGLTFAAPVTLDPPQAGVTLAQDANDLPILASGLTITGGALITLTLPVTVNAGVSGDIVNIAAITSTEVITPQMDDVAVLIVEDCDVPANPVANCSFETGDLTGWVTEDLPSPLFPLQVGGAGIDLGYGAFSSEPTHGSYAALHGFDGEGPGSIQLAQDVTLPPGFISLEFIYRAGWDLVTYGAMLHRHFQVTVEPPGGGPYLFQTTTMLTAVAGTKESDSGKVRGSVDLSAFAGRSVRVSFRWNVPESFSGPAFFQLDNVFVRTHAPPDFTSTPVTATAEDETYTYAITATDVDPGEKIVFSAPIRPAWLTLTDHGDDTATLGGRPTNADVGDHAIELWAQDDVGLVNMQSFTLTVSNVNDAPIFTSAPVQDAAMGMTYTCAIVADDMDVGDVLTITAPALPAWLTLTDHGNGTATLSGTPVDADVGDHDVALRVTDGTAVVTQSFTVAVRYRPYLPLISKP